MKLPLSVSVVLSLYAGPTLAAQEPPSPAFVAAKTHLKNERYDEAREAFRRLAESEPDNELAWVALVWSAARTKDFVTAAFAASAWEGFTEQRLSENPVRGENWIDHGCAVFFQGRFAEAVALLERGLELGYDARHPFGDLALPAAEVVFVAALAQTGELERGLDQLELLVDSGFEELELLREVALFQPYWPRPRFEEILLTNPPEGLDRNGRWRWDLKFLKRRLLRAHTSPFVRVPRADYERAFEGLDAAIPDLADHEIVVGMQRLLAMAGDGHTALDLWNTQSVAIPALPLRFHRLADGLYLTTTIEPCRRALGRRVVSIGNTPADEALRRVDEITSAENSSFRRWMSQRHLRRPALLHALGLLAEPELLTLGVEGDDGTELRVELSNDAERSSMTQLHVWDETPGPPTLPMKHPADPHWFELLDQGEVCYAFYGSCRDGTDETIAAFVERLFRAIDENPVRKLVIDIRTNGGGNTLNNRALMHAVIRCEKVNRPGGLFVLIGPNTYSAAQNCATDMDQETHAIFVGEPTGSAPNFVGERNTYTMPCSGITFSVSSRRGGRSHTYDTRSWIAPDLYTPVTIEDLRTRRDAALDAVRAYGR